MSLDNAMVRLLQLIQHGVVDEDSFVAGISKSELLRCAREIDGLGLAVGRLHRFADGVSTIPDAFVFEHLTPAGRVLLERVAGT